MTTVSPSRLLLWLGAALSVVAIVLGILLLSFGEFVDGVDAALNIAIPVLLFSSLAGFALMVVGAIGWAIRAPIQKLARLGFAFLGLAGVCFGIGSAIKFGFDDVRVLFFQAAFYTPLFVGSVFLLSAGIRRWRTR